MFIMILYTLGAGTFVSRKIREIFAFHEHKLSQIGQNRIFRVLNFREWTKKLIFFVDLRKRLDPDRNKREKKSLLFQVFVVLSLFSTRRKVRAKRYFFAATFARRIFFYFPHKKRAR